MSNSPLFTGPYPPMPRFPVAWKGRIADDELFNDDEDFSMLRKRRKMDKEGSAEWERVCNSYCLAFECFHIRVKVTFL